MVVVVVMVKNRRRGRGGGASSIVDIFNGLNVKERTKEEEKGFKKKKIAQCPSHTNTQTVVSLIYRIAKIVYPFVY
jgi:hypothetical protein